MAPSLSGPEPPSPEALHRAKLAWRRSVPGGALPSNVDWVEGLSDEEGRALRGAILRKPSRTLSGVAVVAVMTAPARCPHGRCTYCPGGVDAGSPQSYTGEEPSALRGAQFQWDAEAIVRHRIETLDTIGHPTSKVEVIVMGGTFPARPHRYQEATLKAIYDGLNARASATLGEAETLNETADHRVVGLTVETRPDWCDDRVLPFLLDAGVTRVELGVECLHDPVLAAVGRAHGSIDVGRATRAARDRGLKVGYHMMLGLPGMDPEADVADFRRLWAESTFRPDFLKIYPTLVLPGTPLFDDWKAGRYAPYDTPTAVDVLVRIKAELPPWVRVHRIQRDIPARLLAAGVRTSNLRELAGRRLLAEGRPCRCLRCREVGRRASPPSTAFELTRAEYNAGEGREVFFAFEEPTTDTVAGFLRLRFPSDPAYGGLDAPVIRELKVLGSEVAVGSAGQKRSDYQHRGFGRALLAAAEERARDEGFRQIYVRSAVGTREYYRARGYSSAGPHMAKPIFAAHNP
jgi:elongator complex protein 3